LPCHSLHKFRHGHAIYALSNANDMAALKAISQNMMHAILSITEGCMGSYWIMMSESGFLGLEKHYISRMMRMNSMK